jgi:glutathione S-transferase
MQLWSGQLSTYSTKVRIVCAEKGVAITILELPWNRQSLFVKSKEFLAVSPRGEVPVLLDGDLVLFDSTVINEYLEEKYPEPSLMPRDLVARARCRLLEDQADHLIARHLTVLVREVFQKPDPQAARDQAAIDKAQTAFVAHHAMLDATLENTPFLCGEFSLADIANFVALVFGRTLGATIDARLTRLAAWLVRIAERPTVKLELDAIRRRVSQA